MSKPVSDLNEAKATRAAKSALTAQNAAPRPRLAERLVQLAPLAKAPLTAEDELDEFADDGLARLSAETRLRQPASSTDSRNALVLTRAAPVMNPDEPVRLSRVGITSPVPLEPVDRFLQRSNQDVIGFAVGVAIAAAIGIGLYSFLV